MDRRALRGIQLRQPAVESGGVSGRAAAHHDGDLAALSRGDRHVVRNGGVFRAQQIIQAHGLPNLDAGRHAQRNARIRILLYKPGRFRAHAGFRLGARGRLFRNGHARGKRGKRLPGIRPEFGCLRVQPGIIDAEVIPRLRGHGIDMIQQYIHRIPPRLSRWRPPFPA